MERRVLIAVLLSFLVLYGYQALFPPPPEPKPAQATSKAATAPKASGQTASNPTASVQGAPQQPEAEAATPSTPARDVEVDSPSVHAVFTTRGARPQKLEAEEIPRRPGTAARDDRRARAGRFAAALHAGASTMRRCRRSSRRPRSRWAPRGSRLTARGARNSTTPTRPVRAQKIFSIAPAKPYVVNVSASVTVNGNPVATDAPLGPRARQRDHPEVADLQPAAAADFLQGRQGLADRAREDRGRSPRWTACSVSPASTITTSWSRDVKPAEALHL